MGLQGPSIDATPVRTAFLLLQTLPATLALKGFLQKAHLKGQVHSSCFFFAGTFHSPGGRESVGKECHQGGEAARLHNEDSWGCECGISVCTVTAGTSNLLHGAFCE